ncbi:PMD domain-containing protein [Cephalotus follicularis]|uniref:PMD domain-containing protein n=1 Tax=Cephalotus follicularis TaxID=3775 RepID=A0A1Q3C407_CEPFO|nr:PMD domain-containing protein [Cephalotus follicularis]
MITALTSSLKASNVGSVRATFNSWIKYHFGIPTNEKNGSPNFKKDKGYNPKLNLVAFVSFWISRYVFPGNPVDVMNVAIKISKGERFPLAPLFMGSLYKCLDLYKKSMKASLGRSSLLCFVDTATL